MFKQFTIAAIALATAGTALVPAAADAQRHRGDRYAYEQAYQDGYNTDGYRDRGYRDDRRYNRNSRQYRDDRGYYRNRNQRCNSGTTGTIVGAIAGGLLGRSIDGGRNRATGTIVGGAAGALAGRSIGRSNNPGYCR
jgi:uncharacterized protein YcfJ